MFDNLSTQTLVIGLICSLIAAIGGFTALYMIRRKKIDPDSLELSHSPTLHQLREARELLEKERPKKIRLEKDRNRYDLSFSNGRYALAHSSSTAFSPPYTEGSIILFTGGETRLYLGFSDEQYDGGGGAEAADEAKRIYEIVWGFIEIPKQAA